MLSIIVPCYNVEKTLQETLDSVYSCGWEDLEVIMVNDGSTDNTQAIIDSWVAKDKRFKGVFQDNSGLGAARNKGLTQAVYPFVLPLDADNLLLPGFIEKALKRLQDDDNIAAVYGEALLFGEKSGLWSPGKLEIFRMLKYNYIDACALVRKDCLVKIGGYEVNLPYQGHEDWDVWLGFIENGFSMEFIKMPAFKYRVDAKSMINEFDDSMKSDNIYFIKNKHKMLYFDYYEKLYFAYVKERNSKNKTSFVKKVSNKLATYFKQNP